MRALISTVLIWAMLAGAGFAVPVRIKDLADFDGVRGNDLVGYGLVVGLDGTGDGFRNAPFTEEMLAGLLERLGVNVTDDALRSKNVAAVIVTATLPPFARSGSRIDVNVSAIGDAGSLLGGTLVMTPLKAADGNIYAVAQGSIIAGGAAAAGDAARVVEGVPTTGKIPVGGRVEREVEFDFAGIDNIRIALRNADFTTATRVEDAINRDFDRQLAITQDSGTIMVNFRSLGDVNPARVLGRIENLMIEPEDRAKVVIDHKSGTIVVGERVRISRVAVSQGNLTLRVAEAPVVSQPNPFAQGETVTVPRSAVELEQEPGIGFVEVAGETNLSDLVAGLNALGVRPRDMIDILKSIHAAGALHADLIVE
ncbi:flagellar basal body P-ring protein FlgI [Paracoccus sp. 1_MG-2023]|uniref:flagellar basal body P-ring protein FlgI n=1 Tax=unclassified Paracoccus (in: a-proteobacteria) TaxID=2688777 RepID=UPI001C09A079|nr:MULTISPECIES: flagellar basal body P-ring protein FlgI [unclassified Paracoccus (in: a-proteobacteria)]MBU2956884.1 flagellar basal body P-ring protein FlgI [Paracoccus sp. C2R09]MDO6668082.1 flagellar basal body P-ring protein FlgI [Paracoccus sp. 1_MG-2023]